MATIQAKPWPRRMPNSVDQVDDCIWVQMSQIWRHPYWWKELRALYWGYLVGDLSNIHALEFYQQQATAFRLPLAQAEASRCWEEVLAAWVHYATRTSYPKLIPLVWGTSMSLGRRKPWPWPRPFSVTQRGQGCLPDSCVRLQGPPMVHGPPNAAGWWWDHRDFTVGPHQWQAHNAPNPRGRSNTPGGWTGDPRGSGGYHISPWMSQNPRTGGTNQAVWCSKSSCRFTHSLKLPRELVLGYQESLV